MVFISTTKRGRMTLFFLTVISFLSTSALYAHGISDADKQAMIEGGYIKYISLGASHMLTGYDHLLFLFGVIFFLTQFKDIVKFITAFTLGHSITLIFATFMGISANYYLIDAVIALTVVYKGFDNVDGFQKYLKMKSPNLIFLVFCLGLIHGFGLSTRLQQLPLGDSGLLLKIISFNVGVEFGQIIALTVMLFVLATWRKTESFNRFSAASNVGLMIAGSLLLLMQLHGFSHEVFVDDLEFSKASHNYEHLNLTNGSVIAETDSTEDEGIEADSAEVESVEADSKEVVMAEEVSEEWQDSVDIIIPSGRGMEYKFHVLKGETLEYSWKTGGRNLFYDFHGEPKGDTTGYFESYEKRMGSESSGSFTAPFEGSHGWYWKNNGVEAVKVTLKTKGSYEILGIR